jgi:hypothetical protein
MDVAKAAAALGVDEDIDVIPQEKKRKPKAVPKKPAGKIVRGKLTLDREVLRAQIKRVRLSNASAAVVPRGRGRLPGSLNKSTLARLQVAA